MAMQPSGATQQMAAPGGVKLFVGQVPAICSEDQLSAIFGQFGDMTDIQIMRDKTTGRSKGSAWVTFKEQSAADDAIQTLHGKHAIPPQSNPLQIKYAGKQGSSAPPPQQQYAPPGAPPPGPFGEMPHDMYGMQGPSPGMMGSWDQAPSHGSTSGGSPRHAAAPPGVPPPMAAQWQLATAASLQQQAGQHTAAPAASASPARIPGRPPAKEYPSRGGRKLFVGQLPKTVDAQSVRYMMSPFGEIEDLHIMQDRKTGQGTGAAFVVYSTREAALTAIDALNGKQTVPGMQTPLQVRFAEGEIERDMEAKLFVGQVPYTATELDLRNLFGECGTLTEVALVRKGGQSKGCGFVRFQDRQGAQRAIDRLHGQHIMTGSNSPLTVRFADSEQEKRKRREAKTAAPNGAGGNQQGPFPSFPGGPHGMPGMQYPRMPFYPSVMMPMMAPGWVGMPMVPAVGGDS